MTDPDYMPRDYTLDPPPEPDPDKEERDKHLAHFAARNEVRAIVDGAIACLERAVKIYADKLEDTPAEGDHPEIIRAVLTLLEGF